MKNKKMSIIVGIIVIGGIIWYVFLNGGSRGDESNELTSTSIGGVCSVNAAEGGCGVDEYSGDKHEDPAMQEIEISPGAVVRKVQDGQDIILLDVRTPEEYEEIHLENSVLVPVQELSQKTLSDAGLGEDVKDREIIIYCRSGNRSAQAHAIMQSLGYTNIKSIAGGMVHWQEDNYPYTETGPYQGKQTSAVSLSDDGTSNEPLIFLDKDLHEFGKISKSEGEISATFVIENRGEKALEVGELSTSCGCTSAEISSKNIAPGKDAVLTVTFDPNFHEEPEGLFNRTVFIPSNDPKNPEMEATISVEIER